MDTISIPDLQAEVRARLAADFEAWEHELEEHDVEA
jgi:hypothetical protein